MAKYYSDLGYSFKETLNAHVRSLGKDPDMIWSAAYDTIKAVYKAKQESRTSLHIIAGVKKISLPKWNRSCTLHRSS